MVFLFLEVTDYCGVLVFGGHRLCVVFLFLEVPDYV